MATLLYLGSIDKADQSDFGLGLIAELQTHQADLDTGFEAYIEKRCNVYTLFYPGKLLTWIEAKMEGTQILLITDPTVMEILLDEFYGYLDCVAVAYDGPVADAPYLSQYGFAIGLQTCKAPRFAAKKLVDACNSKSYGSGWRLGPSPLEVN